MLFHGRSPDRANAVCLAQAVVSERLRAPWLVVRRTSLLVLAGCAMWATLAAAWPMSAAARSATGTVVVAVGGLPAGQRPAALLTGPGVRRRVTASRLTIRDARAGAWTLRLERVTLTRSWGALRRGASAYPVTVRVTVRLSRGGRARLAGRYGSIVNPGVVSVSGGVVAVGGAPTDPTSVTFAGRRAVRVGKVLSLRPNARLPRGLLARATAVHARSGRTVVQVQAVSIYSVMPVASFDIPVAPTPGSAADVFHPNLKSLQCGPSGFSGVYRRITNIHLSGGWNTVHVLGSSVPVGVRLQADFDAEAGLDDLAGLSIGGSCELDVSASGMAGPVPVTGAVYGALSASASVGLALSAGASVHVSAHASSVGTPPDLVWLPGVEFSNPRFTFTAHKVLQANASAGVGVKVGLGNEDVTAVTLDFGSKVEFSAQPGACSWDKQFGAFSAEGKLLGWDIETPKTPPLFTKNIWHNACGTSGGGGGGGGGSPNIHLGPASFGTIPAGQQTVEHLSASGGTPPYTYDFNNAYPVPSWVALAPGGTLTINPPAGDQRSYSFYTYVTDATSQHSPFARDTVTFQTDGGGGGGGGSGSAIATGGQDSCALLQGGGVDCWGANSFDQLGDGTNTGPDSCGFACSLAPDAVSGITNATAISTGLDHSCARLSTGGVDCWGFNPFGELGDGTTMNSPTPVAVSGLTNATAVSIGYANACALLQGGGVDCWGPFEMLGDGTSTDSSTPVAVSGLTNASALSVGDGSVCALLQGGGVDCWGDNTHGELGNGTTTGPDSCGLNYPCSLTPVAVSGITNATAVSTGAERSCALLQGGGVDCWGDNSLGQLGDGTTTDSATPVAVSGLTDAIAVSAGYTNSCALLQGGGVDCWGANGGGQLGNGTMTLYSSTPVAVSGITNAIAVSAGDGTSCALLQGGGVDCWGQNDAGQLGDGTTTGSSTPVAVSGLP
jgi:alpha-tubulin suppressor-like RCC1 family protein